MKNQKQNQRKIAFFDLDGTLISRHLWLGIFKYCLGKKKNLFRSFWYLLSHIALVPLWKVNLINKEKFYRSWGQDLATVIKGVKRNEVENMFTWVVDKYLLLSLKTNVIERLKKHQKENFLTILTSGSSHNLVEIIARRFNFDFAIGTKLEFSGEALSGKIILPFCFKEEKVERIKRLLEKKNISINFEKSFSYSDSIFDLPVLQLVAHPVAVEPDKALRDIAQDRGWEVI